MNERASSGRHHHSSSFGLSFFVLVVVPFHIFVGDYFSILSCASRELNLSQKGRRIIALKVVHHKLDVFGSSPFEP